MKRIKMEVAPYKGCWMITKDGVWLETRRTQAAGICCAKLRIAALLIEGRTVTLKIKRPNGNIREERTYPRSSDPKRTKG